SVFVDCVEASNANALWDEVLRLAVYLNRSAPSAALEPVWKIAANSPCLARLPSQYRGWIELFRSVGNRDAAGIVRHAEPLLDVRDKTPAQIEYLVLALATGQLAQGQPEQARTVLNDAIPALAPGRKDLPWF